MNRKILSALTVLGVCLSLAAIPSCSSGSQVKERPQWTEKQAWEWDKKVGIIKGFNQPEIVNSSMTLDDICRKMSELGFNSVRSWCGGNTAEEQVERIRILLETADKYGMTVSPVLSIHRKYLHRDAPEEQNLADAEKCVRTIVAPFKDDKRIIMWDIWNEPVMDTRDSVNLMKEMDWIEKEVHWCREEQLSQPITASIFWDTSISSDTTSVYFKRRREVEQMMDIHNFHDYMCSEHFGEDARVMISKMKKMGNRPLVCTECLTRVNGSGLGRTLAEFAKEHVHFYIWGSYANNANWEVKWGRTTYDVYEPMFHNIMYSDGDLIDFREVEDVRKYNFDDYTDEGLEITERWTHERAWKRMDGGPVKGQCGKESPADGFNSVRMKLNYSEYVTDSDEFFARLDEKVRKAEERGYTIMPVLLTDEDAGASKEDIGKYVGEVVGRYYCSPAIQAWDLYYHPGETVADSAKVADLVTTVFRYARNEYPNQPLTMTPYVRVKEFAPDFDYRSALIHGHRNGWNRLEYGGGSNPALVYKIWSLSDVLSFSTDQPSGEAGWLASICYKFGRPVFCTDLASADPKDVESLIDLFAKNHVNWYTEKPVATSQVRSFRFQPVVTQH